MTPDRKNGFLNFDMTGFLAVLTASLFIGYIFYSEYNQEDKNQTNQELSDEVESEYAQKASERHQLIESYRNRSHLDELVAIIYSECVKKSVGYKSFSLNINFQINCQIEVLKKIEALEGEAELPEARKILKQFVAELHEIDSNK